MKTNFVLLDTNIVSCLMKASEFASRYAPYLSGRTLSVCFITVGELYFGAEKAKWGAGKRRHLEKVLNEFVFVRNDIDTAYIYGRLVAKREKVGRPIRTNDAWIAACAVRHGIPLVTHNAKDFENISGLDVISALD